MATPELDDVSDEDFSDVKPSSSVGPPLSGEQREVALEETKGQDRVSEHLNIHPRMPVSSYNLLDP